MVPFVKKSGFALMDLPVAGIRDVLVVSVKVTQFLMSNSFNKVVLHYYRMAMIERYGVERASKSCDCRDGADDLEPQF